MKCIIFFRFPRLIHNNKSTFYLYCVLYSYLLFYLFCRFNTNKDDYLSLDELKRMMEQLGAPQTHLGLKAMIKEVDEDGDGRLSFHEFMLVFRKARAGELDEDSGLGQLARLTEIDVEKVGVNGAKDFFEAKVLHCKYYCFSSNILVMLVFVYSKYLCVHLRK